MLAGQYKTVVTLQRKAVTQTAGGNVNTWQDVETFRAVQIPIKEELKAQYQQAGNPDVTLELRLRKEHSFAPGESRFKIGSKVYLPGSNLAEKGRTKTILLRAAEDVSDL